MAPAAKGNDRPRPGSCGKTMTVLSIGDRAVDRDRAVHRDRAADHDGAAELRGCWQIMKVLSARLTPWLAVANLALDAALLHSRYGPARQARNLARGDEAVQSARPGRHDDPRHRE